MSKQRIAVTWEMCGYIDVEADSVEDAMQFVRDYPDECPLPKDGGDYIDGSFQLSTEDVEMMKLICGRVELK